MKSTIDLYEKRDSYQLPNGEIIDKPYYHGVDYVVINKELCYWLEDHFIERNHVTCDEMFDAIIEILTTAEANVFLTDRTKKLLYKASKRALKQLAKWDSKAIVSFNESF